MKEKREPRYYTDAQGRLQVTMAKSEKPEDELCDFCSGQDRPFTEYKCKDFDTAIGTTSLGSWNACPACAAFIEANDQKGLTNYTMKQLDLRNSTKSDPEVMKLMTRLHRQFFKNRI